jgi:STE24 endopeptidase
MRNLFAALGLCLGLLLAPNARADAPLNRDLPPGLQIPDAARPGPNFDVDRATDAYINLLSPEQRAKSDAYFEGGYWIQLWSLLYTLAIAALLLASGWSRRMRETAQRIGDRPWGYTAIFSAVWLSAGFFLSLPWSVTLVIVALLLGSAWLRWTRERIRGRPWLQTAIFAVFFFLSLSALSFPLSVYTDFYREHQYGLSTQTFAAWLDDQVKGLNVGLLIAPLVITIIYAAVRRLGERWWLMAGALSFVFSLLGNMLFPVFISPLFNHYKPLPEGAVRTAVLSLAHANQIPTEHVEWFDASRQTTRVSANVSGFAGTTRVNLNDNLMNKTSLPEIKAVMGHEMGHYVLNHGLRLTIYTSLVMLFGFWFVNFSFGWTQARWGRRFGVEGLADPAGLPLIMALFAVFGTVTTPVNNSIVRQAEAEADAFGLNAAREPNGFAMSAMRLSTYRKIHPGKWEEIVFYDHPSGYQRVHASMQWLKENQDNPTAMAPLPAPTPPK